MEDVTAFSILCDLFFCALVFISAWVVFLLAYLLTAKLRWVANVDARLVIMANLSAIAAGILSWSFLGSHFSSPNALWMATIAAPVAFLGFCGLFILIGPANVDRSVAFSIVVAVKAITDDPLPTTKLIDAIPVERIISKRLRELSARGLIVLDGDRARLTPLGDRILRFYLWLGRLLNVQPQ
jgi:hypothetical protein